MRVTGIATDGPGRLRRSAPSGERVSAQLAVPGAHNAINAAARSRVLVGLGYDARGGRVARVEALRAAPVRRFELHGTERGVQRLRRLRAPPDRGRRRARRGAHRRRRRPHHRGPPAAHCTRAPSRCAGEFAEVLEEHADHTVVLDVYGAREDPDARRDRRARQRRVRRSRARALRRRTGRRPPTTRRRVAREGDFVITLGCGDVYQIIPQVLDARSTRSRRGRGGVGAAP